MIPLSSALSHADKKEKEKQKEMIVRFSKVKMCRYMKRLVRWEKGREERGKGGREGGFGRKGSL